MYKFIKFIENFLFYLFLLYSSIDHILFPLAAVVYLVMGFQILFLLLFLCSIHKIFAGKPVDATIVVRGVSSIAETDDNFVCATLDWWPPQKCNYDDCPWGQASVLNLVRFHAYLWFLFWFCIGCAFFNNWSSFVQNYIQNDFFCLVVLGLGQPFTSQGHPRYVEFVLAFNSSQISSFIVRCLTSAIVILPWWHHFGWW